MMKEKISPVCVNKRAVTVRLCSGDSLKNTGNSSITAYKNTCKKMTDVYVYPNKFLCRNNLQPVVIRIMNKINSHLFVLKADTAHLLMQSVRCLKIICCKSDMTLILAQLIGLRMIFEPGQLNLKAAGIILQITKREASILRLQLSGDLQSQCLLIKGDAFIKSVTLILQCTMRNAIFPPPSTSVLYRVLSGMNRVVQKNNAVVISFCKYKKVSGQHRIPRTYYLTSFKILCTFGMT